MWLKITKPTYNVFWDINVAECDQTIFKSVPLLRHAKNQYNYCRSCEPKKLFARDY